MLDDHPSLFVLILLLGIALLLVFGDWIRIIYVDNVPSKVFVDGVLVYKGSSAGFEVLSGGYTTTVTIYGGFLYLFPQQTYTSKDVIIKGTK